MWTASECMRTTALYSTAPLQSNGDSRLAEHLIRSVNYASRPMPLSCSSRLLPGGGVCVILSVIFTHRRLQHDEDQNRGGEHATAPGSDGKIEAAKAVTRGQRALGQSRSLNSG